MKPIAIHIDFETRSACDLKKASTHKYAQDPSTDVWCMAYAIGDDPIQIWKKGEPFPSILELNMLDIFTDDYYFIAHNAAFEYVIWNEIMHKRYGWPELPLQQLHCTMAMAYAMALPGSLENAAIAVGLTDRKDMEGRELMMRMARPRNTLADGSHEWWETPERLERLYKYCMNDVKVERELEKRLVPLKPRERAVWLTDQLINNRGVQVDINSIDSALKTVEMEKTRLDKRIQKATDEYVGSTRSVMDMTDFLIINRVPVKSVSKADVRAALELQELPGNVREMLLTRQEAAKSSTAKLKAMMDGASEDNGVRGILQYHGAGTGRWAGRKLQPQNMPRPTMEQSDIENAIEFIDDPDMLRAFYGQPMQVISNCLRAMIIAKPDHELISADYSNIEGRMLAWLAGEEKKLMAFELQDNKQGPEIYIVAAADIYNVPANTFTKKSPERQVGKVAELALGYQGGVGAFQTMARGYGVDMATAFDPLWDRATTKNIERAERMWKQYLARVKGDPITREAFMASELTKQFWREAHPNICAYWYQLEEAAKQAVSNKGEIFAAGPEDHRQVRFKQAGSFLFMRLPSGRNICYPYPQIKEITPPWAEADSDEKRPALTYMGVDSVTKSWRRQIAYGGLIAENATQGGARDILVEGMFQVEEANYPVIFHVHDELVSEIPVGFGSVSQYETLMLPLAEWAEGCPIVAEGWRGLRYRK